MGIEARYPIQANYFVQAQGPSLPSFETAEQFIKECQLLLTKGILPNQILNQETSLLISVFTYLHDQYFDEHLDLLFS